MRTGTSVSDRAVNERTLRREIDLLRERVPNLKDDELFVVWFLRAYITEDEELALRSVSGGSRDKGIDAVLIDDRSRMVFVVQAKYRSRVGKRLEPRADLMTLANLARPLLGPLSDFRVYCDRLRPELVQALRQARDCLTRRHYRLRLKFVSLGRCSSELASEASRVVRTYTDQADLEVVNGNRVLLLLKDYLDGVAPPVPSLELPLETAGAADGVLRRLDRKSQIESWVFSMQAEHIASLYEESGERLFARNVRGFLGTTAINRNMISTLGKEPEHFWYYNNGITIVCDEAEKLSQRGRDVLRVSNPQIINGQQTTRTLHAQDGAAARASVLVRVIAVHRDPAETPTRFHTLVSRIVQATNWQNAIRASDLMANDHRQIEIERALAKLGYYYLRKRMKKGEARRASGAHHRWIIKKDELAQAVAACELDPLLVREGKEGLFEERCYSLVFPNTDPHFYLPRYLLKDEVSYASRGRSERAYPKWVVLHFVWSQLRPLLKSRSHTDAFIRECQRQGPITTHLNRAITLVFQAALRFYRANRGEGDRRRDLSTFFKHQGRHREFERFWRTKSGPAGVRFRKLLIRTRLELAQSADG